MCAVKLVSMTLYEANSKLVSAPLCIEVGTKYNIHTKLKLLDIKPTVRPQIAVGKKLSMRNASDLV